jgi:soluble lytic murein transglycosylase
VGVTDKTEVLRRWILIAFVLLGVGFGALRWNWGRREHRFDPLIRSAASQYGLPPDLVKAVVWRESRFVAEARGGHGELGLMQVTETAAQEWADARKDRAFRHEHILDPATNLHVGCFYLAKVSRRYRATDHPYLFALADYNAGRGNVLRWMQGAATTNGQALLTGMTYPGTREYVQAILARRTSYAAEFR